MNRNETKLLVENWRRVLNEGLHDSDPELLKEGFLQDFADDYGRMGFKGTLSAAIAAASFLTGSAFGHPFEKPLKDEIINVKESSLGEEVKQKLIEQINELNERLKKAEEAVQMAKKVEISPDQDQNDIRIKSIENLEEYERVLGSEAYELILLIDNAIRDNNAASALKLIAKLRKEINEQDKHIQGTLKALKKIE